MAEESTKKPNRPIERIGKYEILEHIASGGMGIVYLARDPDLDRLVALKILPPDLAKQHTTLERFRREARAAALLRHDNIVAIYDIGEANGAHYIALEYVDGTDLQAYISRKCRLDPNVARQLMIQAARALVHAHEHGIVHRDLKPSNFLLMFKDKQIILKLTDFGLAIRNENEAEFRITRDKTTVGTVDYMSPEQARDSRSADIRSDIYSLGCTFYHMLGGTAPFARGTLPERIVQHMRSPPPDVRKLNKSVPEAIVVIIQRMLAKRPDDRYQTPADLLHDLEHPESVELPGKRDGAKRARDAGRKRNADVTSVIENKELDEASAEPTQVKSPRAGRMPRPGSREERATDDTDGDADDSQTDAAQPEQRKVDARPARTRTKNPHAASSPIWMYATAGTVAVLGFILVLAFAFGTRPMPPRKDGDKKIDPPPPVVIHTDKKIDERPPLVVPAFVDTAPEKMTVVAPPLPMMDLDPVKVDLASLRKEYYGGFESFPAVPETAARLKVRRLGIAGSSTLATLTEAMALTKADQFNVIEIYDNGPIFVSALPVLTKRTICLRGGDGFRPLIVWDLPKKPADPKAPVTFLTLSEGRLILENVDFVMKAHADTPATLFDLPQTDFFARACTFSLAGKSPEGLALIRRVHAKGSSENRRTQTWLQRCYLRGPDAQLLQHQEGSADVMIEESLLVNHLQPMLSLRCRDEDAVGLHCVRSTLVTGQVLVRLQATTGKRFSPQFQGRVLDSILSRDDAAAPQGDLLQIPDASDTNRMNWKASNCVYAGWKQLLASNAKDIAGQDLDGWRRQWAYSLGDRVVVSAWPSSPPSGLEDVAANAFLPGPTPLAYAALTGPGAAGCVIGRLPAAPENWHEGTLEPRLAPVFANIDVAPPRVNPAKDGLYHGEHLDLNRVDLGAYLTRILQKETPAPRIVMHLTGKGVCLSSPLRVKGVQHLVLYFEPSKDPVVLEPTSAGSVQRGPFIEISGGHLEMIGARIRLSPATFNPTMIQVRGGNLTLSRCWLGGPLSKTAEAFKSLITIANPQPLPITLLMRENVLVSTNRLIHVQENVQVQARNNVLVALGDGVLFDVATPTEALLHHFDHNTFAVRQTFLQLKAGADSAPDGVVLMQMCNNAFLRPFEADTGKAPLTRGFEAWSPTGRWIWQGKFNVYDARLPAYDLPAAKGITAKQTLKDWQQIWGQAGEVEPQLLEASPAMRDLTLDGVPIAGVFTQLDRLALPRLIRINTGQGLPGADLVLLGILKKKG